MNPTVNKILHALAVAVFLVSGLGATLTSFKAFLPPVWYQDAQNVVAVCMGLVLYMLSSPVLKGWLPVQSPVAALDAARDRVLKDASKTAPTIAILALCLAACLSSGAPKPQTIADLQAAEADLKVAIPVACVLADALDPALMTAICVVADAADNLLTTPAVVTTGSSSQAAALVMAHPATAAVGLKLTAVASQKASVSRKTATVAPSGLNPDVTLAMGPPLSGGGGPIWEVLAMNAPIIIVHPDGTIDGAHGPATPHAIRSVAHIP